MVRRSRLILCSLILLTAAAGCGGHTNLRDPPPPRPGLTVGVQQQFPVSDPRADPEDAYFGELAATMLVAQLRAEAVDAYLVPPEHPGFGDVRITGSISLFDRGNRAARCIVGLGAGRVKIGMVLNATNAAGVPIAQVSAEHSAHFCDFGDAEMKRALSAVIRDMVGDPKLRAVVFMPGAPAAPP